MLGKQNLLVWYFTVIVIGRCRTMTRDVPRRNSPEAHSLGCLIAEITTTLTKNNSSSYLSHMRR